MMKKIYSLLPLAMLLFNIGAFSQTTYYVTPDGSSSNDGSSFSSPMDLSTALDEAEAGDEVVLSGDTYTIDYTEGEKNTIKFSKSGESGNYITVRSEDGSIATLDFSFPDMTWVQSSYGLYVTGDYWYFKGLKITHAGYQGAYVTGGYNVFENCIFYDNRNTGLEINKGGHHTTVLNCDSYYNYDPKKDGSMADGFGPKQTQGAGNTFVGCRAWYNSDDGFDCYDSPEVVEFEDCWAFYNGIDVWNFEDAGDFSGNGNGFKVGGNYELANHVLTKCISFGNPQKGFDQNNNTGGVTMYNCTAYDNGTNFGFGGSVTSGENHILKNNISLDGSNSLSNTIESNNSWNDGFSVSSSDFESLDLGLATTSRNSDGSIPGTDLFRLKESSDLIDAGTDVGLDYSGSAPDLGAFEYESTSSEDNALTLQEDATGFCSVDGAIESDHTGYTGSGYANTTNTSGAGIDYKITVGTSNSYAIKIRYAATGDRPADLIWNGSTVVSDISLPSTDSWKNYSSVTTTAYLSSGTYALRLEATTSSGLPNIDYLQITGDDLEAVACASSSAVTSELKAISEENEAAQSIEVFPNPFTGTAVIQFSLEKAQEVAFELYDITGKLVDFIDNGYYGSGENELEYSNSDLKTGLYILSIKTQSKRENIKLMVK